MGRHERAVDVGHSAAGVRPGALRGSVDPDQRPGVGHAPSARRGAPSRRQAEPADRDAPRASLHGWLLPERRRHCDLRVAFHDSTRLGDDSPIFDGYLPARAHGNHATPLETGAGLIAEFEEGQMQPIDVPVVDFETQHDAQGCVAGGPARNPLHESGWSERPATRPQLAHGQVPVSRDRRGFAFFEWHRRLRRSAIDVPWSMFVRAAAAELFRWAEQGKTPRRRHASTWRRSTSCPCPAWTTSERVAVSVRLRRRPAGAVPGPGRRCRPRLHVLGTESPLAPDVLASRYDDVDAYMQQFTKSLDATIDARILLKLDRATILEATAKAEALLPTGS